MKSRTLPRREVLTSALAVSAASAAAVSPYIITSAALGNAMKKPASERITVGHIGVGGQGRWLLAGVRSWAGAQSVAVADAYKDRREAVARQINGKAYADFRELLARDDIDAVVVATPDHWHVPVAIAAARAKKDAYVEKPLGVSIEQCLACLKVFTDNGRIFQYGTQQRSSDHCRFGCELVRSGRIGKVHTLEVIAPDGGTGGSTAPVAVPPNLDYQMWLGPAPDAPYTADRCNPPGTYWIYDYSIGYLGGWGAHPLDILVWGSDADMAGPYTVEGTGKIPATGLYNTVYNWDMKLEMAGGVKMTFKPGGDSTKFIGTEGWVQVQRGGIDAHPKSLLASKIGPGDVNLIKSNHHQGNFIEAVRTRKPAISNLEHAVRSDIISHLSNIAVRLGRKITWDPKTQTIVGDAEAAKLMHRPMRAPWTL